MKDKEEIWPKKIQVDKRIVEILSGSTYENFPKAIKEVITNSYDADATNVYVLIDIPNEVIEIIDNGLGMNESDFDFYLRIAGKSRQKKLKTSRGRQRIGKFGVGFLAVFPFFRHYSLESTKAGLTEITFANILCSKFFDEGMELKDVNEIPIDGGKKEKPNSQKFSQYTKVTLSGFTNATKAFFNEAYNQSGKRKTILNKEPLERFRWELSEDLPLVYESSVINFNISESDDLFQVFVNKIEIFRNIYAKNILETNTGEFHQIGGIKFKYFLASDNEAISPVEGRYLKLRNHNVGVGNRETFGIGLEGRLYSKLAHLTGEINVIDGLNHLIKVSRDSFNYSPDFEEFKNFFRSKLREWSTRLEESNNIVKAKESFENRKMLLNIDNLEPEFLNKTEKLKSIPHNFFEKERIPLDANLKLLQTIPHTPIAKTLKILELGENEFAIKKSNWNFEESNFPAIRIEDSVIHVNDNYPLFSIDKHFDVFFKFHFIYAKLVNEGVISEEQHKEIILKTLQTFKSYYQNAN